VNFAQPLAIAVLALLLGCPGKANDDSDASGREALAEPSARYPGDVESRESAFEVEDAGDVNGDGYADILIGAMQDSADQTLAAAIILGSSAPVSTSLAYADATFSATNPAPDDSTGFVAVAGAGDVNADGFDDVVIGTSYGGFVLFGSAAPGHRSIGEEDAWLNDARCTAVAGDGDVNGDGIDDLLMATGNVAYFVPGSADMGGTLNVTTAAFEVASGTAIEEIDSRGVAIAGDVDGDGLADMVIGTGRSGSESAYALLLGATEVVGKPLADADLTLVLTGGEYVADSVSEGGDANGDGYADVVVVFDRPYLFLGAGTPSWVGADSGLAFDTGKNAARGVGDVDGDGFDDVALGDAFSGEAWLAYGAAEVADMNRGMLEFVGTTEAVTGSDVGGGGDVNGDGLADWLVGAPQESEGDLYQVGATYLFLGASR